MLAALVTILLAYILGSMPFGYWTAKVLKGIDIRQYGSGSTGATNVWRIVGKAAGVFVFFADLAKGAVPVLVAIQVDNVGGFHQLTYVYPRLVPVLVALTALIAHSKSIFLNFSGGKSAATGLGTLFALNPLGGLLTFLTWLLVVQITKIVSISSILAVAMCGVYFWLLHSPPAYVAYCIIGFLYVTFRHKANIKRMIEGTEPRIGQKPPTDAAKKEAGTIL